MASKLNYDCLRIIFEFFDYYNDQDTLFKCLLVNRLWCESAVPYLWKDPFSIVRLKRENSRKLLTTIISMFPFDESTEYKLKTYKYELTYLNYNQSFYNYLSFCRIFKFTEFHGFVDKCARAVPEVSDEGTVSSILLFSTYKIIFERCTEIRQVKLSSLPKKLVKIQKFNNFSNLCELDIYNSNVIRIFEKLVHVCKNIKKIKIVTNAFRNSQELVNLFKVQQNLKIVHFLNSLNKCEIISEELSTQIHSIEELILKNFVFKQINVLNTLSKLKRLELSFTTCSHQTIAIFQNASCPLLEVLKFHRDSPPLNVLADFIEKTEGHLQYFYMEPYSICLNSDTQVLLRSIAKSCPKIKSLSTIFNSTEDSSFLKCLLLSCNELDNFTLVDIENDYGEMVDQLLEEQLRINEKWNVRYEKYGNFNRFFIEKA
ncbi:hypothetical protein C1645_864210 [Glomus cerebriforme]|uniref:F-box domain-containing protein n=1 Tax=Glomus cerebriforme TaxID=658196 RepID=A0A397SG14_9GLOM|nr:hypothetical protein C1645_864210 [Glomus cerebriforme]